ncbi:MAG: hypothetical protein HY392_03990 [Candidatus Diapherotrites archaeon]|nr:hypothetical protein [Candidatus Diapherotrites archaeon]
MAVQKSYIDNPWLKMAVKNNWLTPSDATFLFKNFNPNDPLQAKQLDTIIRNGLDYGSTSLTRWINDAKGGKRQAEEIHGFALRRQDTLNRLKFTASQKGLNEEETRYLITAFMSDHERIKGLFVFLEKYTLEKIRKDIQLLRNGKRRIRTISNEVLKKKKPRRPV